MPWINITLSRPCALEKQERIKSELATILQDLMEKPEQGLTITFTAAFGFFRGGARREDAAVVDIKYIGEFPLPVKQQLTRRVAALLESALGLDPQKIIVLMTEAKSENWGRKAGDFS
jgi:phenylpyruvate tautomerase PptA (4-oxalocrotonate tautomerase family)